MMPYRRSLQLSGTRWVVPILEADVPPCLSRVQGMTGRNRGAAVSSTKTSKTTHVSEMTRPPSGSLPPGNLPIVASPVLATPPVAAGGKIASEALAVATG